MGRYFYVEEHYEEESERILINFCDKCKSIDVSEHYDAPAGESSYNQVIDTTSKGMEKASVVSFFVGLFFFPFLIVGWLLNLLRPEQKHEGIEYLHCKSCGNTWRKSDGERKTISIDYSTYAQLKSDIEKFRQNASVPVNPIVPINNSKVPGYVPTEPTRKGSVTFTVVVVVLVVVFIVLPIISAIFSVVFTFLFYKP